jgi:pimeloyl-ACP methyl ester carboxylesterase
LPLDEAREIVSAAANGRLEIFEGAGHFTNLDQPDRFNEFLQEFLRAAA